MIENKIKLLLLLIILLNSCQTIKDGLTGQKQNNSDEFLVKKKNRLEMPPDFDKLPTPKKEKIKRGGRDPKTEYNYGSGAGAAASNFTII